MSSARVCFIVAAVIAIAVFASAFLFAPRACRGGEVYFWCGVVALLVLLALPFIRRVGSALLVRAGAALGFVGLGLGAWLAGVFAANVRFFCGLGYL